MLVRFQPWIVVLGGALNVIASIAAAASAYVSWTTTSVSIEAVNVASRNQAFSEYLAAYSDLCKVSLVDEDQDDMKTYLAGPDSFNVQTPSPFEIREIYLENINTVTEAGVDEFIKETTRRESVLEERWMQLQIWLNDEQSEALAIRYGGYSRFFIDEDKRPAAFYAVEQQRRCRIMTRTLIDLFKNPNDERAKEQQQMAIWVLPKAEGKTTEDILKSWGREDIIADLTARQYWPIPE